MHALNIVKLNKNRGEKSVHEHLFRRIRRLQRIANHLRKHTCPQRTLLLGYPDTHQVPRSPTQQEGQRFVLRSPSAVWCLCRLWTVTRRSYSSPGGVLTRTSTAPCLQIGPIYSPSLPHIPHPPAPVPPNSWYRPRLEERERSFWFRSLGE